MSYNPILVNIGGGAYVSQGSNPDVLTIQRANPIYLNQSGDIMTGDLNMKENKIINVKDPSDPSHVVNKRYLDHVLQAGQSQKLTKERLPDTFNEINMNNNRIINLTNPINPNDVANKDYVDKVEKTIIEYLDKLNNTIKAYVDEKNRISLQALNSIPLLKFIHFNIRELKNTETYFDDNGIMLIGYNISNILYKSKGNIISIQLVESEIRDNDYQEDPQIRDQMKIENGYLCYCGKRNINVIITGKVRVAVLTFQRNFTQAVAYTFSQETLDRL